MKICEQKECLLYDKPRYPIVKFQGNNKAQVVVIGEPPNFNDTKAGINFSGEGWQKMEMYLRSAGLTPDDVFFASVCRCQINKKDFPIQKHRDSVVDVCKKFAVKVIHTIKPKVVVIMGDAALKALTGKQGITKDHVHGKAFWSAEYNCWIMPVFGLGYIYRNEGKEYFVHRDFAALKVLIDSNFQQTEIKIEKPEKNFTELQSLREFYKGKMTKGIALDTETQGLQWYNDPFVCLGYSICAGSDAAHWIQLFEETEKGQHDFYIIHERQVSEDSKKKMPTKIFVKRANNFEQKIKELKFIMESAEIPKFFHHGSYDIHAMQKAMTIAGILLNWPKDYRELKVKSWVMDTQFCAHVMDENIFKLASLEKLQDFFLQKEFPYKYNSMFGDSYDKGDMLQICRKHKEDFVYYAAADSYVTWMVAQKQLAWFNKPENKKLKRYIKDFGKSSYLVLSEMEANGLFVDHEKVPQAKDEVIKRQAVLQEKIIQLMPPKVREKYIDDLRISRDCIMRDAFYDKQIGFGLPVKQVTATSGAPSVGKDVRKLLFEEVTGPAFDFITAYHEYEALDTIRTRYLKSLASDFGTDKRMHPSLSLCNTDTGRSSSKEPNLQNLPKRGGKDAADVRRLFIPPPGYEMLKADESQSELRWAAILANDPVMKRVFIEDGDIHVTTGERLAGKPWNTLTDAEKKKFRQNAKPVNFGLLYMMSAKGFQLYAKLEYQLDITIEQAEDMIRIYFETYAKLPEYHEKTIAFGEKYGYVETPFGRRRRLPGLRSSDSSIRSDNQRKAVNVPIQGASSDLVILAGNEFLKLGLPKKEIQMCMFIHDELVFMVKEGYGEKYAPIVKRVMENPPLHKFGIKLDIPLKSDVSIGPNFYDCKKVVFDGYKYMGLSDDD